MEITNTNQVTITGNCTNFIDDRYKIEITKQDIMLEIKDADYDIEATVLISPEDAIRIANEILNYYENALLK